MMQPSLSFPRGTLVKESTCQSRRLNRHAFNPWIGKIPWKRKCQYSCLKKSMDRGAWKATVHGVPKIHNKNWNDQTRLSNWACTSNSTPGYTTGKDENFNLKKDTRTSVFIAALFTTAKTWKKPNCGVCVCIHTHTHTQQNITQPHKKNNEWT